MNKIAQIALSQGLALNQQMSQTATNAIDWLFRRDKLVKSGHTWFELIHDEDLMSVRYYDLPDEDSITLEDGSDMPIKRQRHAVPLVLIPPLGVTTNTFDLMPQRSLVRYMAAAGFTTYLVDWGKPSERHGALAMKDYADEMMGRALAQVRQHAGTQELSLMGWCMGGLLCLMHQGLVQDPKIRNIITVASPIDMSSGMGVIGGAAGLVQAVNGPAQLVSRLSELDPTILGMPDWMTTLVFKMTDPLSSVTTYWDLLTGLGDRKFIETYSTTSDYLNNMLRYPGGVVQDMLTQVIAENRLAQGKIQVGEKMADLTKIKSNLLAFAGKTDNLVGPDVAGKVVDIVASKDKDFRIAPGGHMGVIIGSKARQAVWSESVEWLETRSDIKKPKRKQASKKRAATR